MSAPHQSRWAGSLSLTDLDQSTPEQVAMVLRKAAEMYYEAQGELQGAWSDPAAGAIWKDLARIMERAADSCDRACQRRGLS